VPDVPEVPSVPEVPEVPDEPAFNMLVFFNSFVLESTTTTSKPAVVSSRSGVNTLPEKLAEPVLLNDPETEIS
tara:strand:- start:2136 stop:2354 length:219 start_codon:yes stop_codon:yes gene_type:complete